MWSYAEFRRAAEELALGLQAQGLQLGDRVGLLMHSDLWFGLVDMACLLAGLVTVPLEPSQPLETTRFMLTDTAARAVMVSDVGLLTKLLSIREYLPAVGLIGLVETSQKTEPAITLAALRQQGRQLYSEAQVQQLRATIHPSDLATIVYTADATGIPKGAMLTHENLSADIWAAFSSMPGLELGKPEVALSFLPLSHIFARAFLYGHYSYGQTIYFSSPKRVMTHLRTVRPTIFITVPRLLEKIYESLAERSQQMPGLRGYLLRWAWGLAQQYRTGQLLPLTQRLQLWLARQLVFRPLQMAFGGRLRYCICGGAALKPEIINTFNAAGIPVKQGYGLTETSSVLSYTRDRWEQAGSVGVPIPGVEFRLAEDGEVLVKSPYTMQGYYHNPEATRAVLDADGWFHTGDLGEFSDAGLLTLQGCKKGLFKLSTGKYVAPLPIEAQLQRSEWVRQAVVVGPQRKFCTVLIVPAWETVQRAATALTLSLPPAALLAHPAIQAHYQALLDQLNAQLPHWSTLKRFCLLGTAMSPDLFLADGSPNRPAIDHTFAATIEALYQASASPSIAKAIVEQSASAHSLSGGTLHV
jgi:long-chain acyl-CoA synthetase